MVIVYETWFIILMLIVFPPLGIFLMIKNSFWDKKIQICVGVVSAALFVGFIYFGGKLIFPNKNPIQNNNNQFETSFPTQPTTSVSSAPLQTEVVPSTTPTPEIDKPFPATPTPTTPEQTQKPLDNNASNDNDIGFEENTLSETQIANLSKEDKYIYLLKKALAEQNENTYNLSINAVTQFKYDLLISINTNEDSIFDISEELKTICEQIYKIGNKQQTMQIVLKINEEIATIKDFSTELIPKVYCAIFENKKITKKYIIINI